jgi:regulator of sigma E protease
LDSRDNSQHNPELTPPTTPQPTEATEPDLTARQWLRQNLPLLVLVGAVLAFLFYRFEVAGMVAITMAAIGLGLLIFIHELGHFLVAKWCNVNVQVFSIGFGPALPGCKFKWGETTYKLALFPLGGYVQMLGQVDIHEESDGSEDDPRSYRNKSVLQRMAIISAGVIMNTLLAFVCFVVVFQGPGKDRSAPVVSAVDSGSPAFTEGIPAGAVLEEIGNVKNPYFDNLRYAVMGSERAELPLVWSMPGEGKQHRTTITPRKEEDDPNPIIGVNQPYCLTLLDKRFQLKEYDTPTRIDSPAAEASPPFAYGDQIIATTDPDELNAKVYNPHHLKELPLDKRKPGSNQRDYFKFVRRMQLLAGKEVVIQVERQVKGKDDDEVAKVNILVKPAYHRWLGAVMAMGEITAMRIDSPATRAKVHKRRKVQDDEGKDNILKGDVIEWVKVPNPERPGGTFWFTLETKKPNSEDKVEQIRLDPVRLPGQLLDWARRMEKANIPLDQWKVTLHVKRFKCPKTKSRENDHREDDHVSLELQWDKDWQFDRVLPITLESPMAIPGLGLGYQIKTIVVWADPNFAKAADERLLPEDVIEKVQLYFVTDDEGTVKAESAVDLKLNQWAQIVPFLSRSDLAKVVLTVNRNVDNEKVSRAITLTPKSVRDWPMEDRGFRFSPDLRREKAGNPIEAVQMGLRDTHNQIMGVFMVLRGMLTRNISVRNIGGPVMIATVSYRVAQYDVWEFVFLLGMVSINLAVVNFLPIPVLDGGHMVFLVYEMIRGKPASERVRIGATYAGLLFILLVFIGVMYLDITKLFF